MSIISLTTEALLARIEKNNKKAEIAISEIRTMINRGEERINKASKLIMKDLCK